MAQVKVVRKSSYQGVPQWGISSSSEITPSKSTARKWAQIAEHELAAKPELSKIRQDSESLPSYFLRGYDCEHKRLSPDGDCLDCGS